MRMPMRMPGRCSALFNRVSVRGTLTLMTHTQGGLVIVWSTVSGHPVWSHMCPHAHGHVSNITAMVSPPDTCVPQQRESRHT